MLRPGGSSLSLRAIGSSLRNLDNLSTDRLDEKIFLLMPSFANRNEKNLNVSSAFGSRLALTVPTVTLNRPDGICSTIDLTSDNNNHVNSCNISSHRESIIEKDIQIEVPVLQLDTEFSKENLTKVYFRRWTILLVFCFISLLSAFNWIEYNIIQDVTIAFYNQSLPQDEALQNDAVNWFSMVYMLCYIPLVFPAMFLLDRKGLKISCVLGSVLTAIGSIIKCAAVRSDLFGVAMLGQTVCAIAQAFTLSVPARLSALWFGPKEIATATSIGVFGNQLGSAIGFLIPPNVVLKSDSTKFMQTRFYYLLVPVATLSLISFILAVIFIKDQPDKPPSLAQLEIRNLTNRYEESLNENKKKDILLFKNSLFNLVKNANFNLILISYGINTGTYYSIGTLLNQIVSSYHQNENEKIGFIGLILVLSGLIGAVIGGIILDRTKAYKLTTFTIYACSFGAMVLFTATLHFNIWIIFGTSFLLGFFMTGYLPVGFEFAAEVTYPEPEGTSCGLLNSSAQAFGIFYTYVQGRIITKYGALAGNIFVCVSLLVGTIITGLVKSDLRRQKAINLFNSNERQNKKEKSNANNKDTNSLSNQNCDECLLNSDENNKQQPEKPDA